MLSRRTAICTALALVLGSAAVPGIRVSSFAWAQNPALTETAPSLPSEPADLKQILSAIPSYHPRQQVKGAATLSGSPLMLQLGQQWSERFKVYHPGVEFTRGEVGSAAAITALASNPAAIAGLSRLPRPQEMEQLSSGADRTVLQIVAAVDPLVVVVHPSNPLTALSPQQMQTIFGQASGDSTWKSVAADSPVAQEPIRLYMRGDDDALPVYVADAILGGTEFRKAEQLPSEQAAIDKVASDPAGVALISMGSISHGAVKPLQLEVGQQLVAPTEENFFAGTYPLVRPLTLLMDEKQLSTDGGLRREVISYVLSHDGQAEVVRAGFFPVSPHFIAQQMSAISGPQLR